MGNYRAYFVVLFICELSNISPLLSMEDSTFNVSRDLIRGHQPIDKIHTNREEAHALLYKAIADHNINAAENLIKGGADINYVDKNNKKNGNAPLHTAISVKSVNMVRLLLKAGARLDVKNTSNETPLHFVDSELSICLQAATYCSEKDFKKYCDIFYRLLAIRRILFQQVKPHAKP